MAAPTRRSARSLLGVVVDGGGAERGAGLGGHRGVVLAGDDVGVGDDQPRPHRPARALDPEPAGGAEHTHHRAARPQHVGVGGDRRVRSGHLGRRTGYRGSRIDPVERVQHRPRGRKHVVEAAQDHRALDVSAEAGGARRVQGDGAEHPDEAERDRGDQRRPTCPVRKVQRLPADHPSPQPQRKALQGYRHNRPDQQRPQRGEQRRVRGIRDPAAAPAAQSGYRGMPLRQTPPG